MTGVAISFGAIPRDQVASMTGRELLEAIAAGRLPQAPIAQSLNFRISEVGDGFVAIEATPAAHLLNPLGTVHGGWALTLIDSATGCAAQTLLDRGIVYTTVETKVNFSRPITPDLGLVRAEGRVITRGRKIMTSEGRIIDGKGRILAHGTSTLLVLGPAE